MTQTPLMWTATAPGKALLAGEYAVLHGAPAICVAVDRMVRASFGHGGAHSPFTVAALDAAARITDDSTLLVSGALAVDSSRLYEGRDKLGLGSSAAVTVAALGAALASRGVFVEGSTPGDQSHIDGPRWLSRQAFFEAADLAHADAQGARGSGVDVATAVFGGAIRFERTDGVKVTPVTLPPGLELTFVFTGESASTPALLGRVRQLAERDPQKHRQLIDRLVAAAHDFAAALAVDAAATVAAADAYGAAMMALGEAADAPITTPAHAALRALAKTAGGAAKPSGAGGGDLGVVFTADADATARVRRAITAPLTLLSLAAPAPGLRLTKEPS